MSASKHSPTLAILNKGDNKMISTYQSGLADVNEAQIYYEIKGEGHPLLLVHGYPLDSRMWDAQFDELAQHFRVIRFDFAGHGKSTVHNNDFALVEDIKGLLKFLGIEKTHLAGLSIGGNLSTDFTLAYPEMVEKLILVSTGLLGWTEFSPERKNYLEELNKCNQGGNQEEIIHLMCKAWVAGPFRSIDEINPELLKKYSTMIKNNLTRENGKGKMILPETKTIELVGTITAPTLIVSPDIDFPDFKSIANFLNKKMTNSQLVILPGTAHMLNMEKPKEFNQFVLNFLK
jgi:3-oxoadipate enol-lactonase